MAESSIRIEPQAVTDLWRNRDRIIRGYVTHLAPVIWQQGMESGALNGAYGGEWEKARAEVADQAFLMAEALFACELKRSGG